MRSLAPRRKGASFVPLLTASSLEDVERGVLDRRPSNICFTGLPNARLGHGVDPCDVEEFAARLGYRASLCWSADDPTRFDAHLWLPTHGERGLTPLCQTAELREIAHYGNRPAAATGTSTDFLRDLQSRMAEELPQYMRPSAYVVLDALPRTATGKLDRNALPGPQDAAHTRGSLASARSPIEESLCGVFSGLLDLDAVGIHDNFFDLGGHSLLATRLASQMRETFGVEMPLQTIFEAPTVAGLAAWLEPHLEAAQDALPKITRRPAMELVPASFAQRRLWFLDRTRITGAAYNMPANLRIRGALDRDALHRTLNEIVARHESLRTEFHERDGEPYQLIRPSVTLDLPVISADRQSERRYAAAEAAREFRLDAAPLFRAQLLALAPDEHVLLLSFHHIVSDGWSMGVFVRELGALYTAFAQGQPSPLPPLEIQYPDFALWQRDWEGSPSWQRQLEHWKSQLAGASAAPASLRTRAPRRRTFPRRRALLRFSRAAGCPPESLQSRARRHDVHDAAGGGPDPLPPVYRRNPDRDRLAHRQSQPGRGRGPDRLLRQCDGAARATSTAIQRSPRCIGRVRRAALQAFANQDLPFEKLVEELAPERSLSRNPLIQVMFALQQQEVIEAEIQMGALDVHPLEYGELTVRFDMEFHVWHKHDRLKGLLLYNTDLFDESAIERFTSHFVQLVESALDAVDRPVSRLPLLPEAERQQLLDRWCGGASPYPREPLALLFEEQVEATPDAVALRTAVGSGPMPR